MSVYDASCCLVEAIELGQEAIASIVAVQEQMRTEHGKPKRLHYADNNAAEGRDKTGDKR